MASDVENPRAGYCKESVWGEGRWTGFRKCSRKAKIDGYCTQHHPDTQRKRDEKYKLEQLAREKEAGAARRRRDALRRLGEAALAGAGLNEAAAAYRKAVTGGE